MPRGVDHLQSSTPKVYDIAVVEPSRHPEGRNMICVRVEALREGLPNQALGEELRSLSVGVTPLSRPPGNGVVIDGNLIEEVVSGNMIEMVMGVDHNHRELRIMLSESFYVVYARPRIY